MKDLILEKSFLIIDSEGLENFSMRKLAHELEVQPASLYYHYKNKDEILNDLYIKLYFDLFDRFFKYDTDEFEDKMLEFYQYVLKNRKEFLFIKRYHHSSFLTEANVEILKNQSFHSKIKTMNNDNIDVTHYLLFMGPLVELVINDHIKISDELLSKLVNKIIKSLKEE